MLHVESAKYVSGFKVELTFNDGFVGVANLEGLLDGPLFRSLNDPDAFRQFELQGNTLSWKNGADFASEYLRELASAKLLQAK